jgi:predicted PurR-regulated permease PerM
VAASKPVDGMKLAVSRDERLQTRSDLAWAIAAGGIGIVLFAALLLFTWNFAATLFLLFAGMLLGVALTAMSNRLGQLVKLPHAVRLVVVCLALAVMLSGVVFLGGTTIAQQATALSNTIKSQLVSVKAFLDKNGIDTSYFELGNINAASLDSSKQDSSKQDSSKQDSSKQDQSKQDQSKQESGRTASDPGNPTAPAQHNNLPSASTLASSGGAIVSQTLKLLLGTVSAVGNFFIVLFLGLAFAAQPAVYYDGLLFMTPAKYRSRATVIVDRIGETLERWLIAQIITMFAVFAVTWIGLAIIGIQSSFILGIQAGLLAFIPTVGAIIAGVIVVLASLASGWVAALSAFILFLGVHAMESYVLTPLIQRQALDIPPATLFAFQILLGVVFGIWGLALALPLMAIVKVMIDYFKSDAVQPAPAS